MGGQRPTQLERLEGNSLVEAVLSKEENIDLHPMEWQETVRSGEPCRKKAQTTVWYLEVY